MKKTLLIFMSIIILSGFIYAADNDGTATAVFLRQEQGVRALGMGGAFVAIGKDVESVWWNPAWIPMHYPGQVYRVRYRGFFH